MKSRNRKTRDAPDKASREKESKRSGPPYRGEDGKLTGGNPGNKGGGRPTNAFVRVCKRLSLQAMRRKVRRILRKPDHPHFMNALKMAAAYGWGQPSQSVEVQGKLTLEHLVAGSYNEEEDDG